MILMQNITIPNKPHLFCQSEISKQWKQKRRNEEEADVKIERNLKFYAHDESYERSKT